MLLFSPVLAVLLSKFVSVEAKMITACVGSHVKLEFGSLPKSYSSLQWSRTANNVSVVIAEMQEIFHAYGLYKDRLTFPSNGVIKIKNVTRKDEGFYTRTISDAKTYSETIELTVLEPPKGNTSFTQRRKEKELVCNSPKYKGNPEVEVSLIDGSGLKHNLTIIAKNGKYKCCMSGVVIQCLPDRYSVCTSINVNRFEINESPDQNITVFLIIGLVVTSAIVVVIVLLNIIVLSRKSSLSKRRKVKKSLDIERDKDNIQLDPLLDKETEEQEIEKDFKEVREIETLSNLSQEQVFQEEQCKQFTGPAIEDLVGLFERNYKKIDKAKRDKMIENAKHKIQRTISKKSIIQKYAFNKIISKLLLDGYAVITGISGDGKTSLAYQVMHSIINGQDGAIKEKQPIILSDPSEWHDIVDRSENLVIFIDDMFGESEASNVFEWNRLIKRINDTLSDEHDPYRNYLLMAYQIDVFQKCPTTVKQNKLFQSMHNLSDEEIFLKEEKKEFMKRLNLEQTLTSDETETIIGNTKHLGFLQCCNIFMREREVQSKGLDFFINPITNLQKQLQQLYERHTALFSVLCLIMLNGGKMDQGDFRDNRQIYKLRNVCKKAVPANIGSNFLKVALSLGDTYLEYNDFTFTFAFVNNSIYHAVALILWNENCEQLVKYCTFEFLINIQSEISARQKTESFIIPRSAYKVLSERIATEIKRKKTNTYETIANLKTWDDDDFCKMMAETFEERGITLNKEDEHSNSLLHYAVGSGNIPLLNFLYKLPPSKQQCDKALNICCQVGDLERFEICRKHSRTFGIETVFAAVSGEDEDIFNQVFSALHLTRKCRSAKGDRKTTILQEICLHGNVNFIKHSSEHISDDAFPEIIAEQELLFYAVEGGSVDMVGYLLRKGADPHQKNKVFGTSILQYGCGYGEFAAVKFLSSIPNLLPYTDRYGLTPLHYVALGTGSISVANYLINEGVDINLIDNSGATVFHRASSKGNLNLIKYLYEKNRKFIESLDKNKKTALHYVALGTGSVTVATFLINKGISIIAEDLFGDTAQDFAKMKSFSELNQLLIDENNKHQLLIEVNIEQHASSIDT